MSFSITNQNIKRYVNNYISGIPLPHALRGIPIGEWDVSRVTIMRDLFYEKSTFNEDIGDWIVSNVTDMSHMFSGAIAFNQDISRWNVSNVTDMYSMFYNARSFNQDLTRWNVSNVREMSNMFSGATSLAIKPNWNIHPETNTRNMFKGTDLEPLTTLNQFLIGSDQIHNLTRNQYDASTKLDLAQYLGVPNAKKKYITLDNKDAYLPNASGRKTKRRKSGKRKRKRSYRKR